MGDRLFVLGIDVGSVAASVVLLDHTGKLQESAYEYHGGRIADTLARLRAAVAPPKGALVVATTAAQAWCEDAVTFDPQLASIAAAKARHPDLRTLLVIGGERLTLARLHADGTYREGRANSGCAAGTGGFLDQQAQILGLGTSAELAAAALRNAGLAPKIASRCAVFAKTDIIHAQQQGYSLEAICDGLCRGLAAIVADTLAGSVGLDAPVVVAGGVGRNAAVVRHLERRLDCELRVDSHGHLFGSLGAALLGLAEVRLEAGPKRATALAASPAVKAAAPAGERYGFAPLQLSLSHYPDFASGERYDFSPTTASGAATVEVEVYEASPAQAGPDAPSEVFLGVDVGSTSTKAVLLDERQHVVASFYTRTAGQPVQAAQSLCEAILDLEQRRARPWHCRGVATTGAGRKLLGAVFGADLVVDEITAHAEAAVRLDPRIDTIIEIGGQDAKFTTLRDGRVTFAAMNTVCAAGTGSFVEEQARRLGCPLHEYASRAMGLPAPRVSDRCTVFMQRDLNHLLAHGYAQGEVLASVVHAVRENYLHKVARRDAIGEHIAFQGATARNPALVAAFEQQLGKPIHVSRFCHVTGALGAAHLIAAEQRAATRFRGFDVYKERVQVRSDTCDLCANHCKLTLAEVGGQSEAYGFLCGRDLDAGKKGPGKGLGLDLLRVREAALRVPPATLTRSGPVIGLPAALGMIDELPFWQRFFATLGVPCVTSADAPDPISAGKSLEKAEFCAPVAAYHGHVAHLAEHSDVIFAPVYLESDERRGELRRQFCYYTQYSSSLAATMGDDRVSHKLLAPSIEPGVVDLRNAEALYQALRPLLGESLGRLNVWRALTAAREERERVRHKLTEVGAKLLSRRVDVGVVLLGRPYVCLSERMNKGIPGMLANLGVPVVFQDMLAYEESETAALAGLLAQTHWHYAAKILSVAQVVAKRPDLYPVLLSSFKCGPDSFIHESFRRILDAEDKPYLVLELDEHDSSVGYETRIEAGVRTFRNHARQGARTSSVSKKALPTVPVIDTALEGRTLLLPRWDPIACELLVATFAGEGIDARVLREDQHTLQESLAHNSGQCLPVQAIVQGFVNYVREERLDPERTALWSFEANVACNIGFYPAYMKGLLETFGHGFEKAPVYMGSVIFSDLSLRSSINGYFAYLFGGMLRRLACRVRPYERTAGATDEALAAGLAIYCAAVRGERDKLEATRAVVERFLAVEQVQGERRPKVALFGDLYTRDNDVFTHDLVRYLERNGAEVVTTPYSEYIKLISPVYLRKWMREGSYGEVVRVRALQAAAEALERKHLAQFERVLGPTRVAEGELSIEKVLARYAVSVRHSGESMDNLLKVTHLARAHDDLALFVQVNPAFCCPSLVTEAMAGRIEQETGVPVVTLTYDGTMASCNSAVLPHLKLRARKAPARPVVVATQVGGVRSWRLPI